MFIHRKMVKWDLHFVTEKTPEFLNRVALEFESLQEALNLFIIGHRSFDRSRFSSVFMFLTDRADNIIPVTVNGVEKIFLLLDMGTFENF